MENAEFLRRRAALEACLALGERLGLRQGLPYVRHWSAAADFLGLIIDHILAHRPHTIVECGSGLTTLFMARTCAMVERGRLFGLEHAPEHAACCRAELERYGLAGWATVLDAPLRPWVLGGERYLWYDLAALPQVPIDLLVIDAPPGRLARLARYPALPLLHARLSPACTLFLDDAARSGEREILARWRAEFANFVVTEPPTERGCAVLRRSAQSGGEAL